MNLLGAICTIVKANSVRASEQCVLPNCETCASAKSHDSNTVPFYVAILLQSDCYGLLDRRLSITVITSEPLCIESLGRLFAFVGVDPADFIDNSHYHHRHHGSILPFQRRYVPRFHAVPLTELHILPPALISADLLRYDRETHINQ